MIKRYLNTYQAQGWKTPRRLVVVRQKMKERPKATGKQLKLFKDQGMYQNYRYSCYITNLDLSSDLVWDLYKKRADCENRIKEFKEDFGFKSFNINSFPATEAALNFMTIAYNLMSLFKQAVLKTDQLYQLKTMRYKILLIGGYITKQGNQRILKMSLAMKRRKWIKGIWTNSKDFSWPFVPT